MNTRKLIWVLISLLALGGVLFVGGIGYGIYRLMRPPTPAPTPEQQLLPGGIAVRGKHIVVHAPVLEQRNAEHLATLGDEILETYSRYLNTPLPREPIPYYLLDTVQDYERADAFYNEGRTRLNLAFSQGGRSFVFMQPRPGQTIIHSGDRMEQLLAHELCHALQQRLVLNYGYQPNWLKEGIAEAWSERALSHTDSALTTRDSYYGTRIILLRHAIQTGQFVPIRQLFQASQKNFGDLDHFRGHILYAESYALARMLDDPAPANAARRRVFHEFLNEVNTLMPDEAFDKANARFLARFGAPDLTMLQTELLQRIKKEKVSPWESYTNQIVSLPGGELQTEAFQDDSSLAFWDGPAVEPALNLQADAQLDNIGSKQANLLFGRVSEDDYYSMCYGVEYVTLLHHNNEGYQTLANLQMDARRFAPGLHHLNIKVRRHSLVVKLDGKIATTFLMDAKPFPAGQWGVGCYDGRVTFRNIRMQMLPKEGREDTIVSDKGAPVVLIKPGGNPG